jgi:tripartite-type tricarboxylate transporter receptor subunit TctC
MHCSRPSAIAVAFLAFAAPLAFAQTFPTKPLRLIAPYPPGGGNDIISRILAEKLGPALGQNVIVENRAGAGGNVGTEVAARAPADGHTMVMGSLSHAINASLYSKLPFDPVKDFAPITLVAAGAYVLVSHPSLPVRDVKALVALAKARPGQINYGSAGNGAGGHLGMELFKNMAGIDLVHVPYKGTAPAMAETVAGQVSLDMDNMLALLPQVKAGRLRPLAVTTLKRSPLLPEVPTMDESGYRSFEVSPWFGVLAPAATPKDVVARLNSEMVKVLRIPEVRDRLMQQGAEPVGNTPEQFGAYLVAEVAKWAKVVKATGARID